MYQAASTLVLVGVRNGLGYIAVDLFIVYP
jgi:hypothetical protein